MKSIMELVAEYLAAGYTRDAANAKAAHDIVLLAMQRCGFKANSTVKGGVVMSSLTGDVRRATMDMDIDFIRYSIGDAAVARFVSRMSKAMPGIEVRMVGKPVELKHDDYRGKRVVLLIKDGSVARGIRTKIDIGIHANDEIAQIDFAFKTGFGEGVVELQANSQEQIFSEKLLSLLRHGASTNRPKDIFDMYYLTGRLDLEKLNSCVKLMIYGNPRCRVNDHAGMMNSVRMIFGLKVFSAKLARARANWLQLPANVVLENLERFLGRLS